MVNKKYIAMVKRCEKDKQKKLNILKLKIDKMKNPW